MGEVCTSVLFICFWRRKPFDGIDEVSWNRRGLHNRAAELHEILISVATNSDCVSLSLGPCSLFTFGVGSLLLHIFDAPFKI